MNETTEATPATPEWEWAIVEIFGHRRHVGRIREEERFGAKMLRIDVPKIEGTETTWSSHYYGGSSIFSLTPTDEKTVMNYAERTYTPAIPYRDHGHDQDDSDDDGELDFGGDDGERDGTA